MQEFPSKNVKIVIQFVLIILRGRTIIRAERRPNYASIVICYKQIYFHNGGTVIFSLPATLMVPTETEYEAFIFFGTVTSVRCKEERKRKEWFNVHKE